MDLLVTIQLRFPSIDRSAVGEHITPTVIAALAAGGITTNVSVQEYDPEEDSDA